MYKPRVSDRQNKKYYIVTDENKEVHFGDSRYEDYTQHKDPKRKEAYLKRHAENEDWTDINTAGFWSRWYLWNKPSKTEAYKYIRRRFL